MSIEGKSYGGSTRDRLLAAAEDLFATKGVGKTTARDIIAAAGANIAAINYYFGSKEALAEELFVRLAERVTRQRLDELSGYLAQARSAGEPVRIEPLVACFVRPYTEPGTGRLFAGLVLEHRVAPTAMTTRVYEQYLNPFAREFIDALCLVDDRPRIEWTWNYSLMTGTLVMAVTDVRQGDRVSQLSGGLASAAHPDQLGPQLVRFLSAAMRAPA